MEDVTSPQWVIQLGVAPIRIDLLSQIPGLPDFEAAWKRRVDGRFGSVISHYVGLDDLIRAKEETDRLQDRADARVLHRAQRQQPAKRLTRRSNRRHR